MASLEYCVVWLTSPAYRDIKLVAELLIRWGLIILGVFMGSVPCSGLVILVMLLKCCKGSETAILCSDKTS